MVEVGECDQGDTAKGVATLSNTFAGPVVVHELSRTCSCGVATEVSRREVPAGETTDLTVEWRVGARRGRAVERSVVLYQTPDGSLESCEVEFRATVRPDVAFEPSQLEFVAGVSGTATATFRPGRLSSCQLLKAATDHPSLVARLDPAANTVTVTFTPPAVPGWASDQTLSVECDSPHEPTMRVPIRVRQAGTPPE